MGWLFGRKKAQPKVPFPQAHAMEGKSLRFPNPPPADKVIKPDQVKQAAGVAKPAEPKAAPATPMPPAPQKSPQPVAAVPEPQSPFVQESSEPLFMKVDVYQRLLGEMDELKHALARFPEIHRRLENSEYNEETNFSKLKRTMKVVHDRMVQVDKTLFKA